jgi:ferrous iron transport protein B
VLPGTRSEFFLEIPPLRRPRLENILVKTMGRTAWYLKEAVPLFILGTLILFFLHKLSLIELIEKAASPVVTGVLALPPRATEAFIIGFLRRDYGAAGLFAMQQKLSTAHGFVVLPVAVRILADMGVHQPGFVALHICISVFELNSATSGRLHLGSGEGHAGLKSF